MASAKNFFIPAEEHSAKGLEIRASSDSCVATCAFTETHNGVSCTGSTLSNLLWGLDEFIIGGARLTLVASHDLVTLSTVFSIIGL